MLTKQFEGGNVKCGKYWPGGQYGPYQLRHVSTSGAKEEEDPGGLGRGGSDGGGGFFNLNPQDSKENKPEVCKWTCWTRSTALQYVTQMMILLSQPSQPTLHSRIFLAQEDCLETYTARLANGSRSQRTGLYTGQDMGRSRHM